MEKSSGNKPSISINQNVANLKESATLLINQKVKELKKKGQKITHLGFGESPFPVFPKFVEAFKEAADRKEYLPTQGLMDLRESIASFLENHQGHHFKAENIFIGPGSKELLFQLLYLIDGDVIIPAPSWVSYRPQVMIKDDRAIIIQTKKEDNYELQADDLRKVCEGLTARQKLLILNSPSNPTGHSYSKKSLEAVAKVCEELNILVISDEIYGPIQFNTGPYESIGHHLKDSTFVTGGISKFFNAGGYRLGFLAIPDSLASEINRPLKALISETYSCVSTPTQIGSIYAFNFPKELADECQIQIQIHKGAAKYLEKRFAEMKVDCSRAYGAFYLFVDFENYRDKFRKRGIESGIVMCHHFLEVCRVAMLPGEDFYMPVDSLTARVATVDYDGGFVLELAKKHSRGIDSSFIEEYCPSLKNGMDRLEAFLTNLS